MLGVKKGALEPDAASGALGAALGHKGGRGVRGRTRVPNAARWCQEAAYAAVPVGGTCCWTPSHPLKPPLTSTTSDLAFLAVARVMGGSAGSGASSSRLCRDGTWSSSSWGGGDGTHTSPIRARAALPTWGLMGLEVPTQWDRDTSPPKEQGQGHSR